MKRESRREFLKSSVMLGGALALGPWGGHAATAQETKPLDMCIARWNGELAPFPIKDLATKLTEQAVESLGGMKRFVRQGDVVWVKPNIAWNRTPEQAANTNPDVVGTLVRLCLEAGAKTVKVGDNTCNEASQTYPASGIEAAVREAGGRVVYVDSNRFRKAAIGGDAIREWEVYPEIVESDLVINVPIVKHHNITTATLCMKNYMGVIGGNRGQWHQNIAECLRDITAFMKPRLCVLDAIRVLTAHGPTGGNLADVTQLNILAAGTDIVALDALGAELLGHQPDQVRSVAVAHASGLGEIDYRKLTVREIMVS